jgi:hypothetical protein
MTHVIIMSVVAVLLGVDSIVWLSENQFAAFWAFLLFGGGYVALAFLFAPGGTP